MHPRPTLRDRTLSPKVRAGMVLSYLGSRSVLETDQVPFGSVMAEQSRLVVCFGSWGGHSTGIGAMGGGSDAD